jgi:hypothetical protein
MPLCRLVMAITTTMAYITYNDRRYTESEVVVSSDASSEDISDCDHWYRSADMSILGVCWYYAQNAGKSTIKVYRQLAQPISGEQSH